MSLVIDEEVANRAACIIQRAWRCWVNKAPFKWCKARISTCSIFLGRRINPDRNKFLTFFGCGNPM